MEAQGRGCRPNLLVRNLPVRAERGLRLEGTRRVEETNVACFTDSQAHPVSTRLPQAPLCLRFSAKTGPAELLKFHKPPPPFLGAMVPD